MPPDTLAAKEQPGISLKMTLSWPDMLPVAKPPQLSAEGIAAAKKETAFRWEVDLSEAGRMRIAFDSLALPLPQRSELRAREDRYGHIVLWPNTASYRVLAPGALRTTLGERRVDVTPISLAVATPKGSGSRLGLVTRNVEVVSTIGVVRLEIAKVTEAGQGGPLLCRSLLELVAVDPRSDICAAGDVPLLAHYTWPSGRKLLVEATTLLRRTDLAPAELVVPPVGASYLESGLPSVPEGVFLSSEALSGLRTSAVEPAERDLRAPPDGFIADNQSDALRYLLIDGVPVVAVPAASERYVVGTQPGSYTVEWRTFLGDQVAEPKVVDFPARIVFGDPSVAADKVVDPAPP